MRRAKWVVAIVLAVLLAAPASAASRGPVRKGVVIGGEFTTGPDSSCQIEPDCAAWLASGCDPRLAGVDPAVQTSIVDVRKLSRWRTRTLVVRDGPVDGASGVQIGGFRIQFWTSRCTEVWPPGLVRDTTIGGFYGYVMQRSRFKLPPEAAWMTVAADDILLMRWELY